MMRDQQQQWNLKKKQNKIHNAPNDIWTMDVSIIEIQLLRECSGQFDSMQLPLRQLKDLIL